MVSNRPYISVVKDLQKRKQVMEGDILRLQNELAEIDQMISGLTKMIPRATDDVLRSSGNGTDGELTGISMRWAILIILAKEGISPLSVNEIVEALREGGVPDSVKLRPNAGAVLSRMCSSGEVINNGNSYVITDKGRESRKFLIPQTKISISLRPSNFGPEEDDETVEGV